MNQNQIIKKGAADQPSLNFNMDENLPVKANTGEDNIPMHEAEIITPQPYGVFALCKIIEHLQIN